MEYAIVPTDFGVMRGYDGDYNILSKYTLKEGREGFFPHEKFVIDEPIKSKSSIWAVIVEAPDEKFTEYFTSHVDAKQYLDALAEAYYKKRKVAGKNLTEKVDDTWITELVPFNLRDKLRAMKTERSLTWTDNKKQHWTVGFVRVNML